MKRLIPTLLVLAATAAPAHALTCNGSKKLCSRAFNKVVLPATHNSMSAAALGFQIPNQPVGIPDQLSDGVRGFLIDTHYGRRQADGGVTTDDDGSVTTGAPRDLYLCHVVCQIGNSKLVPVLRSMRDFVRKHPGNVLLLDVEDYVTPKDFVKAMKRSGLDKYVYRGSTKHWPTLRTMIKRKQQVVVLAEHRAGAAKWLHLDYQGIVQETAYTWEDPALITDPANWPASCAPNRGGTKGSLFLMNHWSPSTPRPQPDPVADAQVNATAVLVGRARACQAARGLLPTIVAVDQYRTGGLFDAVRQLNGLTPAPA
jgi:hypothetical protein